MKVRSKLSGIGELDRKQLEERFQDCVRFQAAANQLTYSLSYVDHILTQKHGAAAAKKGLSDAHEAAKTIKEKFWIPEEKNAYAVMKKAGELLEKVKKSPDGPALDRIQKSVQDLAVKAKEVIKAREDSSCGIRFYETVQVLKTK